jgi:hypothetical protein
MRISPVKAGFALGFLLALYHAGWSLLVASGLAQPVLNFVLWAHFLRLSVQIAPFDTHQASLLVGATAIAGFVMGAALGAIWNGLHPKKR